MNCTIPPLSCPAESDPGKAYWRETPAGTFENGKCFSGFKQSNSAHPPQRYCYPNGTWDSSVRYGCLTIYCPSFNDTITKTYWPSISAKAIRQGYCNIGGVYLSRPTRQCTPEGSWNTTVISNPCITNEAAFCPVQIKYNVAWPSAPPASYAFGICTAGHTTNNLPSRRYCRGNGQWASETNNHCV